MNSVFKILNQSKVVPNGNISNKKNIPHRFNYGTNIPTLKSTTWLENSMSRLRFIEVLMYMLLGGLIAATGSISFILLQKSDINNFSSVYQSSLNQIAVSINRKLHTNIVA